MTYRDDFYTVRNIIGYTGDLMYYPTVYFKRGHEYGHITQHHMLPYNIGREEVFFHPQYHVGNYVSGGRLHGIEWEGARAIHPSRNKFIRRELFSTGVLLTLSEAIFRFPDLKISYADVRNGKRVKAKNRMQAELLKQFDMVRDDRLALFMPGVDRNPAATRVLDKVVYG